MSENVQSDGDLPDREGRPLEVYEWGGGIAAGLGFFLTPFVTAFPVLYCALKIRAEKPLAATGIGVAYLGTFVFWSGFLFGDQATKIFENSSAQVLSIGIAFLLIIILPVAGFVGYLLSRR
ncbi:hypothetical protein SAMN05216226_11728 [Halovenus aranensis]|jgi:uncharacterized PurR-regulated membrane protein YhhQ (DUF165 family)|uniref:Uncharacterized protein n=1 Tax=Halovenus aranensis TaxID=890420 RepID=A0A1G8Z038_9EURY|nr:hypothetical protein [Halovenus aranensis]SDK08499.1 hypothetical protein SAMN05216226_11728 [Halovenus aranensis]